MENQQNKQYEEEIEIYDYFQMIKKRKWQLIIIFLAAVLIAAAVSFLMPKIYESSAIVKIGKTENVVIQTTDEIIKTPQDKNVMLRALSGDLLEIKARGKNPQKNLEMVNQFVANLLNQHQQIYQEKLQPFEAGVALMEKRKTDLENETADLENKIRALGAPTSEVQAIVFQTYTENLNSSKYQLNQLNLELIAKNQQKDNNFQLTKLAVPPVLSNIPIRPQLKLNLIIGIALGIFLGLFWVFVAEYWEKK